MSFFGFMSAPVSIPPVFDTTPCLEHLMEYEDCVIDVNSSKKQLLMPTWPTLYPSLLTGRSNERISTQARDMTWVDNWEKDDAAERTALTPRQKQLLYECEEERMVYKACARELIKLRRTPKMTSWDTCEAANMGLD
jgi:hypothetical protein